MANRIHNVLTGVTQSEGIEIPCIAIGLDIDDPFISQPFMATVAEQVLLQRMCSTPSTTGLFITIVGTLDLTAFRKLWLGVVSENAPLAFFMSQMTVAKAIVLTPGGEVIDETSLLKP